jgi:hypothetical protein
MNAPGWCWRCTAFGNRLRNRLTHNPKGGSLLWCSEIEIVAAMNCCTGSFLSSQMLWTKKGAQLVTVAAWTSRRPRVSQALLERVFSPIFSVAGRVGSNSF